MIFPRLARMLLRLGGWEVIHRDPEVHRAVIVAAHHTSNWDGFWALVYKVATGLEIKFFIKHQLFWFPLNILLHRLGGIPLDRAKASKAVEYAVQMFDANEQFYFGLAPEGTRGITRGWKSGFYRIAEDANVPVILAFFCYRTRRIGLGPSLTLTGDIEADLKIIRSFYDSIEACHPEKLSPVRLLSKRAEK